MGLMERRRHLLANLNAPELYPIGTDILAMYIGKSSSGRLLLTSNTAFDSTGEIIQGNSATSNVFIPVKSTYAYQKGKRRIRIFMYDSSKKYIGPFREISTWQPIVQVLPSFPDDVEYIRCAFLNGPNENWIVDITRIG